MPKSCSFRASMAILIGRRAGLSDIEPAAAQPPGQQRRPCRMVLAVEGQLALAPALFGGGRRRGGRAAAQVLAPSPSGTNSTRRPRARKDGAQVGVLGVHEVALVEQSDGLEVRPPGQQTGRADPGPGARRAGEPLDRGNRPRLARARRPAPSGAGGIRPRVRLAGRTRAPARPSPSTSRGPGGRGAADRHSRPVDQSVDLVVARPPCRDSAAAPGRSRWRGYPGCWRARSRGCRRRRSPAPPATRGARASSVPSPRPLSTTTIVVGERRRVRGQAVADNARDRRGRCR